MKKLLFLLFLLHLMVMIPAFAQKKADFFIRGQLVDEIGRYPVTGAKISIPKEKIHAITNKEGFFSMKSKVKSEKFLTIEWMNKERSILFIPSTDSKNINLKQILIDAPFSRPVFLDKISSSAHYE